MSINLKTLISKLNDTSRIAATRAASICVGLGQYEVDLEHLFLALLEQPNSDFVVIARKSGISVSMLEADLQAEVARLQTGNARTPVFSARLPKLFEHAWLIASLDLQAGRQASIRSAHLLQALLTEPELAQLAYRGSKLFNKFNLDDLKHKLDKISDGSQEAVALADGAAELEQGSDPVGELAGKAAASKTPALDQFTTNLTQRARDGKVDPVIGRDMEIRQAIDILMRRRQNNPILTGEAGVGKTAVVEGLALRIALDDVPDVLKGVEIHTLDMGLLQAGASVKGEFENRLKNVIDEVKKSPHAIILFIDEAHTMIGAGGTAGQNDAANLLKPALARGELRTIAATTWGEYKKYFEKDAALARRFQVVKIEEPSEELACAMLRGMAPLMEKHFNVRVYDEAITEAVRLSHRYIMGRQLPDKAISVLDTACAKVALGQSATPALIENLAKKLERIDAEAAALEREESSGASHPARLKDLRAARSAAAAEHTALAARWETEKALTEHIKAARLALESGEGAKPDASQGKDLQALLSDLRELQGETPMVPVQVDGHVVAEIVAGWTGIPLGKMVKDEIRTVLKLKDMLEERVLGQSHAIDAVAQRVRTARANLDDPNKPKGVFLFVGPSGVGKTETALALADVLYGGERKLITINMSEYQEAHSVSGLKGSPPGYVGYGEGGVLTEAVRRNPYSVVLLDEVEKAHPDVLELFFQVFDKGVLDDAEGREIDFKNTIIILTSNVGSGTLMQACLNVAPADLPTVEQLEEKIRPQLVKAFKPAFLGRLKVIPFYPISDDVLVRIIGLKLRKIAQRIALNHKAEFSHDDALVEAVLARCTEVDSGARNVDNILNGTLLPEIAESVLARMAEGAAIGKIKVSASKQGQFKYTIR
ncbi:type VI secretion system ATPase TssH [Janthinobacterium agaricidamnosum]|uniref:Type VI secretion ATPase, ClpV1 family n=1 Tax=Janthinobacterium agaricidamnosum NBRC 102515 = DSM 9628 TaxID=1349767 RepID=W0V755_9BURK|nr:type VI secretion system ATPase TssH [Janthinobacterium agaricidamnosum]CDG83183.1 type VI secretion ATPase, ClpV1 family [Janthinobacterium agaricidamnosum NBRC 102515 = DSM 9628]